jgi:PAP2 superfamily
MRPFFLSSGSEFRAPPPPALGSQTFLNAVIEVRKVSDSRTTEQLRIAQYWEMVTGSFMPGFWNQTALEAADAHHLTQAETTQVLALVHMAWVDAFIACADSKYVYWVQRPTQVDPEIRLAIGLPNHPSYPSNHACTASTTGRVLDGLFPDQGGRYLALAQQAAMSRLYGGIHYQFDIDAGIEIGRELAAKVLAQRLPPDRVWLPAPQ